VATVFMLLASLVAAAGFAVIATTAASRYACWDWRDRKAPFESSTNGAVVGAVTLIERRGPRTVAVELTEPARPSPRPVSPALLAIAVVAILCDGRRVVAGARSRRRDARPLGRPPRPKPARHSALALVLIAAGIGSCSRPDSRRSSWPGSWRRSRHAVGSAGDAPSQRAGHALIAALALRDLPATKPVPGGTRGHHACPGIAATVVIIAAAEE
jgi:hypothetical protein